MVNKQLSVRTHENMESIENKLFGYKMGSFSKPSQILVLNFRLRLAQSGRKPGIVSSF
jgi:hypothetical protein